MNADLKPFRDLLDAYAAHSYELGRHHVADNRERPSNEAYLAGLKRDASREELEGEIQALLADLDNANSELEALGEPTL